MTWSTETRDEIARVLEIVAKDGLPGPRDLDVALDAIQTAIDANATKRTDDLVRGVQYARAVFAQYEKLHLAKDPPDKTKALANATHARHLDGVLAATDANVPDAEAPVWNYDLTAAPRRDEIVLLYACRKLDADENPTGEIVEWCRTVGARTGDDVTDDCSWDTPEFDDLPGAEFFGGDSEPALIPTAWARMPDLPAVPAVAETIPETETEEVE